MAERVTATPAQNRQQRRRETPVSRKLVATSVSPARETPLRRDAGRPLDPTELVLIGLYRMVTERDGEEAGAWFVDAIRDELARLSARRDRPRPILAFSAAVDADQAVRR